MRIHNVQITNFVGGSPEWWDSVRKVPDEPRIDAVMVLTVSWREYAAMLAENDKAWKKGCERSEENIGLGVTRHDYTSEDVRQVYLALEANQGRISKAFEVLEPRLGGGAWAPWFLVWLIEEVQGMRLEKLPQERFWEEWVRRHGR